MFVGLERRGSFRRLFSIVEKHVQRELKCPCHPLQGFEAWYRIAVFYARDVAPQQSGRHPMTGAKTYFAIRSPAAIRALSQSSGLFFQISMSTWAVFPKGRL